jgi:outer membrane protein OmpA-like peptidoglycan-associated protein
MILRALLLLLLFGTVKFYSQNGELGKQDCSYAKEVLIPFNYSADPQHAVQPMLNQKVFYTFRDQFSFWYKVVVKQDQTLTFKVKALNDSDAYTVFVYNYNLPDVCDKVYYQKISPVKSSFFIGKGSDKFVDDNEKMFRAKKDNVYYINVLNTSLNNCGHRFWLGYGTDTLKVEAIHLPCKRDYSSLALKSPGKDTVLPTKQVPIHIDTKPEIIKPVETVTAFFVRFLALNRKNKNPVDCKLTVTNKKSEKQVNDINPKGRGEFEVMMEENEFYVVKAEALGYKTETLTVSSAELKLKNRTEIMMEPLQKGESFILKSIYFVPNTYALRRESLPEMEKLLAFMKGNPDAEIEIQGHTNGDNRIYKNKAYASLSDEWNFSGSSKKLSQKRAEVIKNYLMHHGIKESRLVAKGYGGKKYLVRYPETNDEAQKNIRVEVSMLKD